jgi:hypothetical protein
MPRAVGCFRRVRFAVEAYPVDWHTLPCMQPALSGKFGGGLAGLDAGVHEWLGLFANWITGRSGESSAYMCRRLERRRSLCHK